MAENTENTVEVKSNSKGNKNENKPKKKFDFAKPVKYLRDCKGEVKKIVWPTPKAAFKNMGIVLLVIAVIGLFIFGLDQGLYALFGLFMVVKDQSE